MNNQINSLSIPLFSDLDVQKLKDHHAIIPILIGITKENDYVIADLTRLPSLLVAGQTGSGKSVWIHSMLLNLLLNFKPDELKLILIDPKMVELNIFNGIPHLLSPTITNMDRANDSLAWCVEEIKRRYQLFTEAGFRNISQYNNQAKHQEKLPYIVVVVDEFADLLLSSTSPKTRNHIIYILQIGRSSGIHLILATQRLATGAIINAIKANIPSRIAFKVATSIVSERILYQSGAESLIGRGDLLFLPFADLENNELIRLQTPFVTDQYLEHITTYLQKLGPPNYIDIPKIAQLTTNITDELDPLYDEAVQFVRNTHKTSISAIQRHFGIDFNQAARIIDQLEYNGIISSPNERGRRTLL